MNGESIPNLPMKSNHSLLKSDCSTSVVTSQEDTHCDLSSRIVEAKSWIGCNSESELGMTFSEFSTGLFEESKVESSGNNTSFMTDLWCGVSPVKPGCSNQNTYQCNNKNNKEKVNCRKRENSNAYMRELLENSITKIDMEIRNKNLGEKLKKTVYVQAIKPLSPKDKPPQVVSNKVRVIQRRSRRLSHLAPAVYDCQISQSDAPNIGNANCTEFQNEQDVISLMDPFMDYQSSISSSSSSSSSGSCITKKIKPNESFNYCCTGDTDRLYSSSSDATSISQLAPSSSDLPLDSQAFNQALIKKIAKSLEEQGRYSKNQIKSHNDVETLLEMKTSSRPVRNSHWPDSISSTEHKNIAAEIMHDHFIQPLVPVSVSPLAMSPSATQSVQRDEIQDDLDQLADTKSWMSFNFSGPSEDNNQNT